MSSPKNMRTGISLGGMPENYYTEIFYIIYLILLSFLNRVGLKDGILYTDHNNLIFDKKYYDSGIYFNLISKYGVGVDLKPMVKELFKTMKLNPDTHMDNVYYQEIVRLTSEVSNIIRQHDNSKEIDWTNQYAFGHILIEDDIETLRLLRLYPLLSSIESEESSELEESSEESYEITDYIDIKSILNKHICYCDFCIEFRDYILSADVKISHIINRVLTEISLETV